MSYETLPKPKPGRLADAVARLAGEMLAEISSDDDRITIPQCLEMITTCPPISAAVEAKVLLGISLWGDYTNANEEQQAFVRENFERMDGTFQNSLAEIYSVSPIGWVASEISHQLYGDAPAGLRLQSLQALDPRNYSFRGKRSQIEDVLYQSPSGTESAIDYKTKILHIVNKPYLAFGDPTGVSDCRIAAASWQAWKIVVNEALLAGQRQATPIIVGISPDTTVPLLDSNGRPLRNSENQEIRIPATAAMATALEGLNSNAGYLSLQEGSSAGVLNAQTNGQFFMELLEYFQRLMLVSFMVPETLFQVGRGGLGNAGLADSHLDVLMRQLEVTTDQIKDQLKEKVVRPLIEWQYGEQESYGEFSKPEHGDENRLGLFTALTQAISSGTMSAADIEVVNRHRGLAGIAPVTEIVANLAPQPGYAAAA